MSSKYEELRVILKCILRGNAYGRMQLVQLTKDYERQESDKLSYVAGRYGFSNVSEMLASWPEFKVYGSGLHTTVEVLETDHITEMNRRSKNKGGQSKYQGKEPNDNYRRPFEGKDPYAFSTDSGDNSLSSGDDTKYQHLLAPLKPTGPELVKTVDKSVPRCIQLEEYQNFEETISIRILDAINPHRFWFAEKREIMKLNSMMVAIKEFYVNNDKNELKLSRENVLKGLYVAVFYTCLWHRAKVLKVLPEGIVRVFYVDFGTVEDVNLDRIRFLCEEFLQPPCFAQRGVLSHIQPENGAWSKESANFFKKNIVNKKFEAKIFKKNDKDSSYLLSMKTIAENGKDTELVSNVLIKKGFCDVDTEFLEKEIFNETEMEFIDYENGKHLKDPHLDHNSWLPSIVQKSATSEKTENWLPSPSIPKISRPDNQKSTNNLLEIHSKNSESTSRKLSPLKVPSYKPSSTQQTATSNNFKKNSLVKVNSKTDGHRTKVRTNKVPSSKPSVEPPNSSAQVASLPLVPARQIVEQNFNNLQVGTIKTIYIHVVNDIYQFYFYLKDEFLDIREFLKGFNNAYEDDSAPELNVGIGNDVVTRADGNYCRGRIIANIRNGESFKIFLLDFGFIVERTKQEILKLRENWMHDQSAVYEGQLAKVPEHTHIKSREQFMTMVTDMFIRVKVSRIDNYSVELLLLAS